MPKKGCEVGSPADAFVTTLRDLAHVMGVSYSTAKEWKASGEMPMRRGGKYGLPEIIQWAAQKQLSRQLHDRGSTSVEELRLEKLRRESLKLDEEIRNKRFVNSELEGQLVNEMDVEREAASWAANIKLGLVSLGDRISKVVPDELKAPIKKIVDEQVRTTLTQVFTQTINGKTPVESICSEADRIREQAQAELKA